MKSSVTVRNEYSISSWGKRDHLSDLHGQKYCVSRRKQIENIIRLLKGRYEGEEYIINCSVSCGFNIYWSCSCCHKHDLTNFKQRTQSWVNYLQPHSLQAPCDPCITTYNYVFSNVRPIIRQMCGIGSMHLVITEIQLYSPAAKSRTALIHGKDGKQLNRD